MRAVPLVRFAAVRPALRGRAAMTRAPGGASSLLRLSAAGTVDRLPSGAALGQWLGRAARSLADASR